MFMCVHIFMYTVQYINSFYWYHHKQNIFTYLCLFVFKAYTFFLLITHIVFVGIGNIYIMYCAYRLSIVIPELLS